MSTLRNRLATGARWTLGVRIVERVIGFASTLILVRLLAPDDFGVVAMGTAIQGVLSAFTDFGFTKALIRMRRASHAAYDTAFTLNVLTGLATAAVLLVCIPIAQHWYADARVVPVMVSLALISVIASLRNSGLARFERAMNFLPFFKLALAKKLAAVTVGAVVALRIGDYKALLAGMAAAAVVEVTLSFCLSRFRPRFTFSKTRELFGFSAWWMASEAAAMLGRRGHDVFIGQQLGAATLGQYAVAYDLATMPTSEIVAPLMRAVFPGYVQMRDDIGRLYSAFVRVWGVIALVAVPSAVGIACLADLMTVVVLGEKWAGAAPLIRVLAAVGALQALHACYWPMLLTRRGPKTVFQLAAWSVGLTLPVFVVLLWTLGLIPAVWGAIACGCVMLVVGARMLLMEMRRSGWPLLIALIRPILGSAFMAIGVLVALHSIGNQESWLVKLWVMLAAMVVGAGIYAATVFLLWLLAGRPVGAESELISLARDHRKSTSLQ